MRLLIHDHGLTDELAAYLRSVGQRAEVVAPGAVDVDLDGGELEAYLAVWRVLHPDAAVMVGGE